MSTATTRRPKILALAEGAGMIALAEILSFLPLYKFPWGGSIDLAMFPILLFSLRWGLGRGLSAGFVFGLLQLLFDGAYAWGWQSMVLDYLLAFAPLGLAGLFKGKSWGIFPGTLVGCLGRFLVHHLSGITIYRIIEPTSIPGLGTYDNPHLYSLVYNGSYMIPNTVLALILAGILYVPMKQYFAGNDLKK